MSAAATATATAGTTAKTAARLRTGVRHAVLLLLGAVWIVPLYLVSINATVGPEEYARKSIWAPPRQFALGDNAGAAWATAKLGEAVGSTLLYAAGGALLAVAVAALAAYAIVGLRLRHGFFWFMLLYLGTIFPFQMYLAPLYTLYVGTDLYNTRFGLLLFYTAIAVPFAVFVVRNHFLAVPRDITEAARLDGASALRVFANVFVPLSLNAFAAVFILQFTWIWNDLLFGLTLSRSEDVRPIMAALAALQGQYASTGVPVALAGTLICSIPTFVLFFAVQRVFVSGLRASGDAA